MVSQLASNSSQLTGGDNLVISNVTSSDSGVYECQARNLFGTAQQTARLTVNCECLTTMLL
jgi:hypothetical protein